MDDEKQVTREIAARIKKILENNGMSINALANQAGISPSIIANITQRTVMRNEIPLTT
jgi:lambda repressor-like predicted transcriptional regulator